MNERGINTRIGGIGECVVVNANRIFGVFR